MVSRFDSFVIFAEMRTGSNLLEAALNGIEGITCHGEAFNPHLIGFPDRETVLGVTLADRCADPMPLLARIKAAPGLNGFRYFHDHDPRVLAPVLADPRCAKIILTRNPLHSYVSLKIARATGQWKLGDLRQRKTAQVAFDAAEFDTHLADVQAFQRQLLHGLQTGGQTAFYLDYDDVRELDVLNGLAAFLGLGGRLASLPGGLLPQNPGDLADKLSNPAEMAEALARIDSFALARTPNFEPRRGPNVPGFVAAGGAPLVLLPIRGGPEAQLRGWLAGFGGGLTEAFTQKTLRQWKRTHPGHRSFTVLRHPLPRAWAAFCEAILPGRYAEIRAALCKRHGLSLPPVEGVGAMTPADVRAAFLGFLRFVKANLDGQTPIRVDPLWASQSAVIQGFCQFAPPDMICREERLDEDLACLAAAVGQPMPSLPAPPADPGPVPLAEIHDAELEEAAQVAYARDMVNFGFGGWSARG